VDNNYGEDLEIYRDVLSVNLNEVELVRYRDAEAVGGLVRINESDKP